MSCRGIIARIGGLAIDLAGDNNSHKGHCYSNAESDETDLSSEADDHQSDHQSARQLVAQENGIVKWYDPHRGYGFLVRPDGSELFVHRQRVVMAAGEVPLLRARSQLSFDVWRSPHGRLEAQNVRTTWGRPISNRVSGKRYSLIRREFHEPHKLGVHGQMDPLESASICRSADSDDSQTARSPFRQTAVRPRYSSRMVKDSRRHCANGKS